MTFRFSYRGENQYNEITLTTEWIYYINIPSSHRFNQNYLNKITNAWVKSRLRKNDNIQCGDPLVGKELLLQVNQTLKIPFMAISFWIFLLQETRLVAANFDHTIGVKTPEVKKFLIYFRIWWDHFKACLLAKDFEWIEKQLESSFPY